MIAGMCGSLLSHDALSQLLRSGEPIDLRRADHSFSFGRLRTWHAGVRAQLGPAASARTVFDLVAEPLARCLGFDVVPVGADSRTVDAVLQAGGSAVAVMIATSWGQPAGTAWRQAVHRGLAHRVRWGLCVSGPAMRLVDVDRAYSRRYAEFDLDIATASETTFAVLHGLIGAPALATRKGGTTLDSAIAFCEEYRAALRTSLRTGVHDALIKLITAFRIVSSRRHTDQQVLNESLIVVYRILFLLFAEARGLVPGWHPVYRDGYTIEALRKQLVVPGNAAGVWESLQAVARLAHRGCRAGTLRVPPFNGRLFSPSDAPLADTLPLNDRVVGQALTALTTRMEKGGRAEISYADLGVEQLGSVYEHLLDFDLGAASRGAPPTLLPTGRRKATGTFYTPRALTEFVVRRALAPLVHDATPDRILALRVLDPAMGSGAFLVAACRYLATAYEQALIREGTLTASDVTEADRAAFRRAVAQQCLFGVDTNPMAVQLGRLSLWLATLASDRPLTFLDHRLRSGNSLVGASIEDVRRQQSPGGRHRERDLPLFPPEELRQSLQAVVGPRIAIATTPDDTLEQVRGKERALGELTRPGGPLERWTAAADLWCAAWFEGRGESTRPGMFRALVDQVLHDSSALPAHLSSRLVTRARETAAAQQFFHWRFEFPEVFYTADGAPLRDAGFDVVLGNPPWDMLREDGSKQDVAKLHGFVRGSGLYTLQGRGHTNLYQLFLERTARLLKPGGRGGLILPAGLASDHGSALLRRWLLDRTSIDTFTTLDNRDGIFPIHRSLKFLLLTFGNAGSTMALPARMGLRSAEALDRLPDLGVDPDSLALPRAFLDAGSGEAAVPDIRTRADLDILMSVLGRVPALGAAGGWGIHFGRELNATEDRGHFNEDRKGLPVVEGKQLHPFRVDTPSSRYWIRESVAARVLEARSTFGKPRLAYRDVASPTNRTTLIAAIVPPGAVTTHTVFCLKEALDEETQQFLCGIFNSYVANYLVRMRVGTHVTASLIARLPVPRPPSGDADREEIARLSGAIASGMAPPDGEARLNAKVARLYGLSPHQFRRVLDTFPLVPAPDRDTAFALFEAAHRR